MRGEEEMLIPRAQRGDNNSIFIEFWEKSNVTSVPGLGSF
jgi:hypothetical protein